MWNRCQFSQSGLLTAIALCSALSFTACSGDDDDDTSLSDGGDASARDAAVDARSDTGTRADVTTDAARPADASVDVASEARVDAGGGGSDATAPDATDARVADVGIDVARDVATDVARDVVAEATIDAGVDARVDTGADAGPDARVDAGVDAGVEAAVEAATVIDAGVEAAAEAAPPPPPSDAGTLQYDFETGAEDWDNTGAGTVTVASVTTRANSGTHSLLVTLPAAAGVTQEISVYPGDGNGAERGTITFSIFVPTTSTLTLLTVFDQTVEPQSNFQGAGVDFTDDDRGTWQTYSVNLPKTFADEGGVQTRSAIEQVGFQLEGAGPIYIDSVRW